MSDEGANVSLAEGVMRARGISCSFLVHFIRLGGIILESSASSGKGVSPTVTVLLFFWSPLFRRNLTRRARPLPTGHETGCHLVPTVFLHHTSSTQLFALAPPASSLTSPPKAPDSEAADAPQRWDVWAEDLAYEAATKRLLRELRHLFGGLDALAPTAPNMAFALESLGTSTPAPGASPHGTKLALLESIGAAAEGLCEAHGLSARALTAAAAGALSHASAGGSRRLGALCLLLNALDRPVAADAAVCAAARRLVQCCNAHGQAHLEDLSLGAAHARALGTEARAAKEEAKEKTLSEAESAADDGGGGADVDPAESKSPAGSFISAAAAVAARRKAGAANAMEAEAAEAAGGLGLENLRPHLSELRAAAFQLELCLMLHGRGCLRLSSRARAEAAVGFRAGLLVEALGRRCVLCSVVVHVGYVSVYTVMLRQAVS